MTNLKLIAAAGMISAIGMANLTGPVAADPLSPWEKFCLNTSAPGQDLGNCLDGLPSRGRPNAVVAPGGAPQMGVALKATNPAQKLNAPSKQRRR